MTGDLAPQGALATGWRATVDEHGRALAWWGRDRLVSADAGGRVTGFDGASGARVFSAAAHRAPVTCLAVGPDGVWSGDEDGCVAITSATGETRALVHDSRGQVSAVAIGAERVGLAIGREVLVVGPDGVRRAGPPLAPATVTGLAWLDARTLASSTYGGVSLWDVADERVVAHWAWKGSLVSLIASPDGRIVACGSQDRSVHFWRRETGEDAEMTGYGARPVALAFDAASELLATSGGEQITVWSFPNGPEGSRPGQLDGHVRPVSALAFAHRGRSLASGGRDGAVFVWSVARDGAGGAVGAAIGHGAIEAVAWRGDDRALAAIDAAGFVHTWRRRDRG